MITHWDSQFWGVPECPLSSSVFVFVSLCVCMYIDIRRINSLAVKAANTGMIILGGGLVKHHICNANLMVFGSTQGLGSGDFP